MILPRLTPKEAASLFCFVANREGLLLPKNAVAYFEGEQF
jgi:hypothetical protein